MRKLLLLSVLLFSQSLIACPTPAPPNPNPPVPSPPRSDDATNVEIMINSERAKRGLPMLTTTNGLICAANIHAFDMNQNKFCGHTGSDGSRFWERAQKCGTRASGEIVACGHKRYQDAVQGWIRSPGHNAIMFDRKQVSMAASRVGDYWVVIFMK
jgi:uncharacterized protein YkwD